MLFNDIKGHRITKYIKTFTEVNIAFLPYESQVYLLDAAKTFRDIYAESSQNRQDRLERYADQLATLCSILGEYPSIRPENESQNAIDLAHFLQAKLNGFKVIFKKVIYLGLSWTGVISFLGRQPEIR